MGFFTNLLFGDPAATVDSGSVLPKKVQQWGAEGHSPDESVGWGHEHVDEYGDAAHERDHGEEVLAAVPHRVVPELEATRLEPHLSGDQKHVELWATFLNRSEVEIELRQISILGQRGDVGRFLKSGESHQLRIYAGETPHNDAEHKAIVQVKVVENGDYFEADFLIKYHYEQEEHESFYIPESLDFIRPMRDV